MRAESGLLRDVSRVASKTVRRSLGAALGIEEKRGCQEEKQEKLHAFLIGKSHRGVMGRSMITSSENSSDAYVHI